MSNLFELIIIDSFFKLETLTIAVLREYAKNNNILISSTKKVHLVEAIKAHLGL